MALPGGSTAGLIIGLGVGGATAAALEPVVEIERQKAWQSNLVAIPDIATIAELYAGGKLNINDAQNFANRLGYTNDALNSLTWLAQNRLDFPLMLRMWRLSAFNPAFDEATLAAKLDETLAHLGLDWSYQPFLRDLKTAELVGLGDIAYSVVRGILPDEGILPVAPPTAGDYVKNFPQVPLNPIHMANALGFDEDMLKIMVGRSGLSMAPGMAAQALFRTTAQNTLAGLPNIPGVGAFDTTNAVGPNDFALAIAEGDLRNEWADAVKYAEREILTANNYAELDLRGYITGDQRRALTSQHGMSAGDSDLLYNLLGRGVNVHQVLIGERRGGVYNGPTDKIPAEYLASLRRGNLRPEFYNLAYAGRETYPSYFVTRALLQSGAITATRGEELFMGLGWPQDVATAAANTYATATGTAADPHVSKAATQLWGTTHTAYKATEIGKTAAQANLSVLGIPAAAQTEIFNYWDAERATIRHQISVAQLLKAEKDGITNPATGQAYTNADVVAALVDRGYSQADATVLASE